MNKKLLMRLMCALLSVLMLVCMIPAITVSANEAADDAGDGSTEQVRDYANEEERLAAMEPMYTNGDYTLYCDVKYGDVAYKNNKTGEILFTNPWNAAQTSGTGDIYNTMLSQVKLSYTDSTGAEPTTYYSYNHAADRNQLSVKPIKNGIRVEYAIGDRAARTLIPQMIEREAFETKILAPLAANAGGKGSSAYQRLAASYTTIYYATYMNQGKTQMAEDMATIYPVVKEKGIDMYVLSANLQPKLLESIEHWISEYCPDYTFEEMDNDHDYVGYVEDAISPPVFDIALEYTVTDNGLVVTVPAKGLRFDETEYRILDLEILPYMGSSKASNEGYTFLPDGSGATFDLSGTKLNYNNRVYGEDFSLNYVSEAHSSVLRMPVFGQVEEIVETDEEGNVVNEYKRGFFAIIEEGESLAYLRAKRVDFIGNPRAIVYPGFVPRQDDKPHNGGNWQLYADRRYTDDYQIRYIMLSDDNKAMSGGLTSFYECSWMGMACAYRDYLDATQEGFDRLTGETVKDSIPLYIETFGCMDSIEKVLSMPVTVSVPLTTFEDVATMYDYLAGQGVSNVNFKLTGYANGGMYADMPYKLKWEKAVGGANGFEDLTAYAAEKGFALYPDFDFVYTSQADGGSKVNMKKNAARTIENRYTTRRIFSATHQAMVSYYQMVMSPATYSKFYEKLGERYAKYENATGISLESFGNSLNSDYDEDKTVLREEAKEYVLEALAYFGENYDVMLDEANAYTWRYADHILNIPLDSSRYNYERNSVPFMGVVLHGYVQFAGSPLNMEGDLRYAMLKAMENGAAVYFVLSYANTELLKEDVLLSQNYSVRYDIWQSRLVDIYKELNSVLYDVQTKLIVGHSFLDGVRVPDEDELLEDIQKEAEELADKIREEIESEHLELVAKRQEARNTATNAASNIKALMDYLDLLDYERQSAKRDDASKTYPNATYPTKMMVKDWNSLLTNIANAKKYNTEVNEDLINTFYESFKNSVIARVLNMEKNKEQAARYLVDAIEAYEYLVTDNANAALLNMAANGVAEAEVAFEAFMTNYLGTEATVTIADNLALLATANPVQTLLDSVVYDETQQIWIAKYDAETDTVVYNVPCTNGEHNADTCDCGATALRNYVFGSYDIFAEDGTLAAEPNGYSHATHMGLEVVCNAYLAQLINDNLFATSDTDEVDVNIDIVKMVEELMATEENGDAEEGETDDETVEETVVEAPVFNNKYAPDSDIVLVTFGESGQKFGDKGTKSLILNFNDYAIRTTVGGVTYTVEAYGYVVIYS